MSIYGVNNALSGRIIVTDDGSYKNPQNLEQQQELLQDLL